MKSDKTIIIAIIAVVVVIVGVVIFAVVNGGEDEQTAGNGQVAAPEDGQVTVGGETGTQELPTFAEIAAASFNDVSRDADYATAVGWMLENELTSGCGENSFCPDEQLPRQQLVTFLWRAAGSPEPSAPGSAVFQDVEAGSFYDKAVGWAVDEGITTGCLTDEDGARSFCSEDSAKRAHLAAFLYRHVGAAHEPAEEGGFDDVGVDAYYNAPASWLAAYGIDGGCGDNNFCPGDSVSRAQAAVLPSPAQAVRNAGRLGNERRPARPLPTGITPKLFPGLTDCRRPRSGARAAAVCRPCG